VTGDDLTKPHPDIIGALKAAGGHAGANLLQLARFGGNQVLTLVGTMSMCMGADCPL
jgi:NADPH-dependent curcumin reductase CurA